jgi:hypothetical protein
MPKPNQCSITYDWLLTAPPKQQVDLVGNDRDLLVNGTVWCTARNTPSQEGPKAWGLRHFGAVQNNLRKGIQWLRFLVVVCSFLPPRRVGLGERRRCLFKGGKWGSFNRKLRYMTPSSQAFISILKNLSQGHVFVEIGRKDLQHPLG